MWLHAIVNVLSVPPYTPEVLPDGAIVVNSGAFTDPCCIHCLIYQILCVYNIDVCIQVCQMISRLLVISAGTAETHFFRCPPLPGPASSLSCSHFTSLFHPSSCPTLSLALAVFLFFPSPPFPHSCPHLLSASGQKTQSFIHLFLLPPLCILFIMVNITSPVGEKYGSIWSQTYQSK